MKRAPRQRMLLIGLILVTALFGAGILAAGYGGPGIARGTSEALGYPTLTPTDTAVPAAPTATTIPPTATSVPPTPTSVPPSPTPIPPSPTPAPPTATVTPTPSPTPTAAPLIAPLAVQLGTKAVAPGDVLTLRVKTLPGLKVTVTVRYPSLGRQTVAAGTADRTGLAVLKIAITQGPARGKNALAAILRVTVADKTHRATASSAFTVYLPVHLAVTAKVTLGHGVHQVLLTVSVARAAAIQADLTFPHGPKGAIHLHGLARKGGAVVLRATLPTVHGSLTAQAQITVHTPDGVTETRTLTVRVS